MFFDEQSRIGHDKCWIDSQNLQSKSIYEYNSFNPYKTNIPKCEKEVKELREFVVNNNMHFKEGYGVTNACFIDHDTSMRNNQIITHGKCKNQVTTRLFQGVPDMSRGGFEPIIESRITQGEKTDVGKSCEPTKGKGFDVFTPLIPCLKDSIQNVDHIVPTWVRGGEHTRDHIKQKQFLERNGYVLKDKIWEKKSCS